MVLKDTKSMYEVKVDVNRGIVYEKVIGLWSKEDMMRFQEDYAAKVIPLLKGKKWVKCSDIREYKPSNVVDELKNHLEWCLGNGFAGGTIIVESTVAKMQMNRSSKSLGVDPVPFESLEEAEKWLKTQGF